MCTEFNLKIDESTELLDTRTFDNYDTNELLQLSDAIKKSCFEFLFSSHIECCPYCGSIHIVKAGKTVKEDNVINAIIVNEDSLIVQII
ncbi:hypothetical protein [Faecalitalea cylindroides]|uniref:hypothetical protein n=1 Tax=Faecalitalea cylindroides TaxID=39483 RepID=UPI003AB57A15